MISNPAAASGSMYVLLNATPPASVAAPAAVTEFPGTSRRTKVDLSRSLESRQAARVSGAWAAGTKVAIQYSLDEASWFYMAGTASGSAPTAPEFLSGAAVATIETAYSTIPTAARTSVFLRGVTLDGDAVTTGATGSLALQTR